MSLETLSPWRSPRAGRGAPLPPSRLLIRRALNDSVIFEALLREAEAHERFSNAPASEKPRRRHEFRAAAAATDRTCDERLWVRLTPEAVARHEEYVKARRENLNRREALLRAAGGALEGSDAGGRHWPSLAPRGVQTAPPSSLEGRS